MQRQYSLALPGLDGNETHVRARDCLADRFGVCEVRLVPLHIRLGVLRRDQPDVVAERYQLTGPVMRARARFHADEACRQALEECEQFAPSDAALQNGSSLRIDTVDLEDRLGEIETDGSDGHGRLLKLVATTAPDTSVDAEAVHAIKWAVSRHYMPVEKLTVLCLDPDAAVMIATQ